MDTVGNPRSKCMGDGSCRRRTPGQRRRTQCGDVRSACRPCAAHHRSPSLHKSCLRLEGILTGVPHRTDHGVPDTRDPYTESARGGLAHHEMRGGQRAPLPSRVDRCPRQAFHAIEEGCEAGEEGTDLQHRQRGALGQSERPNMPAVSISFAHERLVRTPRPSSPWVRDCYHNPRTPSRAPSGRHSATPVRARSPTSRGQSSLAPPALPC